MQETQNTQPRSIKQTIDRYLFFVLLTALIVLSILRYKVFILATIPTESMTTSLEGALQVDDKVFGNKLAYKNHPVERGDIVIFTPPFEEEILYIKRVIGLPGETVTISGGKIFIDGTPLTEPYVETWTTDNDGYTFTVPEDAYFVMGDNRDHSYDSRYWDDPYVEKSAILAKAEFIYAPISHAKRLK